MRPSFRSALDSGASIVALAPREQAWLVHNDVIEYDVEHRIRQIAQDDAGTQVRSIHGNIA